MSRPALGYLLFCTASFAVVDTLAAYEWIPGGTVTSLIRSVYAQRPALAVGVYLAVCGFGAWHFFGRRPT